MTRPRIEYVYGLNPCFEVMRAGRRGVKRAYLAQDDGANERLRKLGVFLRDHHVETVRVDRDRLKDLSRSPEHQGAVLKCTSYPYLPATEVLRGPRLLLLDGVEDPQNVGAILRSAEVCGFHDVLLPDRGVPEVYPSVVKVAAGATEHLRIARETSARRYVERAQEDGVTVLALDAEGETDLRDLSSQGLRRVLLVIGGEARSVSRGVLSRAELRVGIRQHGRVNSLNASVAAGIALFMLDGILPPLPRPQRSESSRKSGSRARTG